YDSASPFFVRTFSPPGQFYQRLRRRNRLFHFDERADRADRPRDERAVGLDHHFRYVAHRGERRRAEQAARDEQGLYRAARLSPARDRVLSLRDPERRNAGRSRFTRRRYS